jgi:purine-binding chemotaxis protein CheW
MESEHTDVSQKPDATQDWEQIYQRLEAVRTTIKKDFNYIVQKKQEVLKERAKLLAQEPKRAKTDETYLEVVEFQLEYEHYAIETSYIREVYPLKELTPIPCTPPFVLGIINIRGQILSVLDLKTFFNLPEKGLVDMNKVIILHSDEMEFGILTDTILGVRSIPLSDIQPSLPTLTDIRAKYLKGVTAERLVILDAAKILSDRNIIVHEEVKG